MTFGTGHRCGRSLAKTAIELSDTDRRKHGLSTGAKEIESLRSQWAELTNDALRAAQQDARVDHRSLADQGIDRVPTTHKGVEVTQLERRGIRTEVGWRLQQEARERLQRAAEIGRQEREAQPTPGSALTLDTDLPAARSARGEDLSSTLRAQADRALETWREQSAREREDARAREAPESTRILTHDYGLEL